MSRSHSIEIFERHGWTRADAEIVVDGLIAEGAAAISRRFWRRLLPTFAIVLAAELGVAAVVLAIWNQQ